MKFELPLEKISRLASTSVIYAPNDGPPLRIQYVEDGYFVGLNEENGTTHTVYFGDVNLNQAVFYKLVANY